MRCTWCLAPHSAPAQTTTMLPGRPGTMHGPRGDAEEAAPSHLFSTVDGRPQPSPPSRHSPGEPAHVPLPRGRFGAASAAERRALVDEFTAIFHSIDTNHDGEMSQVVVTRRRRRRGGGGGGMDGERRPDMIQTRMTSADTQMIDARWMLD